MLQLLWLIPLGFAVGTFGTLIGAGGGFILVPVLLLIYPDKSPEAITGISLAVVFFNALSGSIAYGRMKRIDYKAGTVFAAASIPGALLGSYTVSWIPRNVFNMLFGVLLTVLAVFLFVRKKEEDAQSGAGCVTHRLIDKEGIEYIYSYNPVTGILLSVAVGYVSSLLGIGGGIIHVPAMIHLLNFPVHLATATSHFVLSVMAFSGSAVHAAQGVLSPEIMIIIGLSVGALAGAQVGARLSKRIKGALIIKSLAVALGIVGVRIFLSGLL